MTQEISNDSIKLENKNEVEETILILINEIIDEFLISPE